MTYAGLVQPIDFSEQSLLKLTSAGAMDGGLLEYVVQAIETEKSIA